MVLRACAPRTDGGFVPRGVATRMAPRGCQCPALLPPAAWGTPPETSPESVSPTATLSPSVRVGRALRPRIVGVCQMPAVDPMSGGHRHVRRAFALPSAPDRRTLKRSFVVLETVGHVPRTLVRPGLRRDKRPAGQPGDQAAGRFCAWRHTGTGSRGSRQRSPVRKSGAPRPSGTQSAGLSGAACSCPRFTRRLGHLRRTLDVEVGRTEDKEGSWQEASGRSRTSVEVVAH
jgi:hypothetical protein